MMSWGLKISRNNSKQNFKFSFSEEQELNIGQSALVHSWWCAGHMLWAGDAVEF